MGLSPRERFVVQKLMIEGKSFAEVRRLLNESGPRASSSSVSVLRLKQILAKAGRKAVFYSDKFDDLHRQSELELSQRVVTHQCSRCGWRGTPKRFLGGGAQCVNCDASGEAVSKIPVIVHSSFDGSVELPIAVSEKIS